MSAATETLERSGLLDTREGARAAEPGLLLVLAAGRPASVVVRLTEGEIVLGRDLPAFGKDPDGRMSRRHALVKWTGQRFEVTDLGSRNGTSIDGAPIAADAPSAVTRVLRAGDSIFLPIRDVEPYERLGVRIAEGRVEGPALQEALLSAAHAARLGSTLHITGESGSGKEGLARAFHAAGRASGPFQAVNCATIPESVAERLLFGAKKGAFSGADADADGYVQAAHGGTLFLDEVAELSLAVQAKLLRVLETGEVLPLGASRPRKVDLRFCSATHRDLRAMVAAGRLREDLYFRIAAPRVVVPPLRDRPEEIAYLAQAEVERVGGPAAVHPSLIEACLLRVWPGNVRELLAEIRSAAQAALAAEAPRLEAKHLSAHAGSALASAAAPIPVRELPPSESEGTRERVVVTVGLPPSKTKIAGALKRHEGNISRAARDLGLHRTQLKRMLERYGIDARAFAPAGRPTGGREDDE
ncbi:MAG: sigma 54-interacting transcriptional regulator [Polyangiaceae bacterium]